jgi:hypothetical protein
MPAIKGKNPYHVQGVSFKNADFLAKAKARAASLDLSLSAYLQRLVIHDIEAGGPIVLTPRATKPPGDKPPESPRSRGSVKSPPLPRINPGTATN